MFEIKEEEKSREIIKAKRMNELFKTTIEKYKEMGFDLSRIEDAVPKLNEIRYKIHEIEEKISELQEQLKKYREDYEAISRSISKDKRILSEIVDMFGRVYYDLLDKLGDELSKYAPELYDFMTVYSYMAKETPDEFIEVSSALPKSKLAVYVYMMNNYLMLTKNPPVVVDISGKKITLGKSFMSFNDVAKMFGIRAQTVNRVLDITLRSKGYVEKVDRYYVLYGYKSFTPKSYSDELKKLLKISVKMEVIK